MSGHFTGLYEENCFSIKINKSINKNVKKKKCGFNLKKKKLRGRKFSFGYLRIKLNLGLEYC